jgi:glycosyltransferase involved in cell wall biosynthesis
MTRFNVVHIVCTDAFAGVERYVAHAAIAQSEDGAQVHVIGGGLDMRDALARRGVAWSAGGTVTSAMRALRVLPEADVIVTHMTAADIAAYLATRRSRTPLVSVRHFAAPRGSKRLAAPLIRAVEARIVAEIAVSDAVAAHCSADAIVIRTGTEPIADDGTAREPLVLVAQRLEAEKHTEDAIRAWALAAPSGWRMAIAGDGSRAADLKALTRELAVDHTVDFLGFRQDLSALMRRASILVAPTANEGLGLSVVEAMAHGLPVVAAAGGGHLETVGAVTTSYLYAPRDVESAARAVSGLVAEPGARKVYGERLRDHQRRHLDATVQWRATAQAIHAVAIGAAA